MIGFEEPAASPPIERFFHPVLRTSALGRTPVRVEVAGTPYALFRDGSGTAGAVLDRCPHRFSPLSSGRVARGRLTCPYHGWNFDRNGRGQSPSQPTLTRCDVPALRVVERYGFVWIAGLELTSNECPTFAWDKFEFLGPMSIPFAAPLHVTLDNFGENEHTPFVHHRLGWNESQIHTLDFEGQNHPDHTVSHYRARQRNTLLGTLVGLKPKDVFHNLFEVRFDPARLSHHIYWTNESGEICRDFQIRAVIYHVPETEKTTWVHLLVWLRVADQPPLGGLLVPLVKKFLMRMVRQEMHDDAKFIPVIANVPNTSKGMRLGKFDKTLVQNHRLLDSIYWGGRDPSATLREPVRERIRT
jgi:phenylpropionate dioxygenase-like ring-hydroxylating dioxygenase large terminal subunit